MEARWDFECLDALQAQRPGVLGGLDALKAWRPWRLWGLGGLETLSIGGQSSRNFKPSSQKILLLLRFNRKYSGKFTRKLRSISKQTYSDLFRLRLRWKIQQFLLRIKL
jgi:hypothetical protein